jgi:hypothetical protein
VLENVASVIEPPASEFSECEWLPRVQRACDAELLLDLHNLHANALNFGLDARAVIEALPLDRVHTLHLAGGRWVTPESGCKRWADDHRHAVPKQALQLLEHVAERAPHPLTVFIERDGAYPAFDQLLAELATVRAALAAGRARRVSQLAVARVSEVSCPVPVSAAHAEAIRLEAFLAALYCDARLRERFLCEPHSATLGHGLSDAQTRAMRSLDRDGLELFVAQLARKPHGTAAV